MLFQVRSVSTPEINFKFKESAPCPGNPSAAVRKMTFTDSNEDRGDIKPVADSGFGNDCFTPLDFNNKENVCPKSSSVEHIKLGGSLGSGDIHIPLFPEAGQLNRWFSLISALWWSFRKCLVVLECFLVTTQCIHYSIDVKIFPPSLWYLLCFILYSWKLVWKFLFMIASICALYFPGLKIDDLIQRDLQLTIPVDQFLTDVLLRIFHLIAILQIKPPLL